MTARRSQSWPISHLHLERSHCPLMADEKLMKSTITRIACTYAEGVVIQRCPCFEYRVQWYTRGAQLNSGGDVMIVCAEFRLLPPELKELLTFSCIVCTLKTLTGSIMQERAMKANDVIINRKKRIKIKTFDSSDSLCHLIHCQSDTLSHPEMRFRLCIVWDCIVKQGVSHWISSLGLI